MKKFVLFALTALLAVGGACMASADTNEETQLMVGAAVRDVTPTIENGMLPTPGLGSDEDMVDVIENIHTRVIALQSGDDTALVVCTETGKGPVGWQFSEILSEHTGVPVEAIFYTTTHTHSAPEETHEISLEPEEGEENVVKWARYTLEQMLDAADEALTNLEPATVGIGYGESYINMNRNHTYTNLEDGSTYVDLGFNPGGFTDRTLAVVSFNDMDGNPIAFIINYPMHGVTMIGNTYFDGQYGVHPDVPGFVSLLLEERYEGAVAMWTSGAAGDQNPVMSTQLMYPDPETGKQVVEYDGGTEIMRCLGYIHYADILSTINSIEEVSTDSISFAEGVTSVPTVEDESFDLHLKVLRIGDIAFVGSPSELYASIGVYMKENALLENTIIFDNVWTQKDAFLFYIGDDEALMNGDATVQPLQPGYVSEALTELMNTLITETNR